MDIFKNLINGPAADSAEKVVEATAEQVTEAGQAMGTANMDKLKSMFADLANDQGRVAATDATRKLRDAGLPTEAADQAGDIFSQLAGSDGTMDLGDLIGMLTGGGAAASGGGGGLMDALGGLLGGSSTPQSGGSSADLLKSFLDSMTGHDGKVDVVQAGNQLRQAGASEDMLSQLMGIAGDVMADGKIDSSDFIRVMMKQGGGALMDQLGGLLGGKH